MARKAKAVGVQTASSAKAPSDPISGSVDQVINDSTSLSTSDETSRNEDTFTLSPSADLAEIKVNKWAQAELKTGTDDAVKQVGIHLVPRCKDLSYSLSIRAVLLIDIQSITHPHRRQARCRLDSFNYSSRRVGLRIQNRLPRIEELGPPCRCRLYWTQRVSGCLAKIRRTEYRLSRISQNLCN